MGEGEDYPYTDHSGQSTSALLIPLQVIIGETHTHLMSRIHGTIGRRKVQVPVTLTHAVEGGLRANLQIPSHEAPNQHGPTNLLRTGMAEIRVQSHHHGLDIRRPIC